MSYDHLSSYEGPGARPWPSLILKALNIQGQISIFLPLRQCQFYSPRVGRAHSADTRSPGSNPMEVFFYNIQSLTLHPPLTPPYVAIVLIQKLFHVVPMAALTGRSLLDVR